jgi:2-amino-4-hydroxy-6-hydroxymethyldihydropteridine diphosphokinase
MPVIAYIGLGSNIGDKKANCLKAVELLQQFARVVRVSSLYITEAVGYKEQEDFINAVVAIETDQAPQDLLRSCHAIEDSMGRKRTVRWGPRTVDLDILLYGDEVVNQPDLIIPHPLMAARKFVLVPLVEIAPDVVHPVISKSAARLLADLKDTATVMKCRPDAKPT